MLLLSKNAQRDTSSVRPLPLNKRERRLRRSVKCNRLIRLFTACKLCIYKKRQKTAAAEPASTLDSVQREITRLSLSLSLCPHESCVRALRLDPSSSDVAQQKKRKRTFFFFFYSLSLRGYYSYRAAYWFILCVFLIWTPVIKHRLTSDTLFFFYFLIAFYLPLCPPSATYKRTIISWRPVRFSLCCTLSWHSV